jgi:regulatory protein
MRTGRSTASGPERLYRPKALLPQSPDARAALAVALRKLHAADRFSAEIAAELSRRGFSESIVEEAMAWLRDRRLLDDRRAVENLIERCSRVKRWSAERIRSEGLRRGAPRELLEEMLSQRTDDDEIQAARSLAQSKLKGNAQRSSAARLLASRGFRPEIAEVVLDEMFACESEGVPLDGT